MNYCCIYVFTFYLLAYGACGILVPWPGIEPTLPALAELSLLTNGPPKKSYSICFFNRWVQTRTNQFFKCTQIVVPEPGNWLKMQVLRPSPKRTESAIWIQQHISAQALWCMQKPEDCQSTQLYLHISKEGIDRTHTNWGLWATIFIYTPNPLFKQGDNIHALLHEIEIIFFRYYM